LLPGNAGPNLIVTPTGNLSCPLQAAQVGQQGLFFNFVFMAVTYENGGASHLVVLGDYRW
jgi:hypothetical protein